MVFSLGTRDIIIIIIINIFFSKEHVEKNVFLSPVRHIIYIHGGFLHMNVGLPGGKPFILVSEGIYDVTLPLLVAEPS